MKEISESEEYRKRISHSDRVECKLPEYNIIQYSKFGWLEDCIELNPFNSEYFFWMDAGLSRFFGRINLKQFFPLDRRMKILKSSDNKFIIQGRINLKNYTINDEFKWGADNLLKGGIFGGHKNSILDVSELTECKFNIEMLDQNNVNNEQLCLAYVWRDNREKFCVIENNNHPAYIFEILK